MLCRRLLFISTLFELMNAHASFCKLICHFFFQVIHVEPRETSSLPPLAVDTTSHMPPMPAEHQSPSSTNTLHAGVTSLQDINFGVDRVSCANKLLIFIIMQPASCLCFAKYVIDKHRV